MSDFGGKRLAAKRFHANYAGSHNYSDIKCIAAT